MAEPTPVNTRTAPSGIRLAHFESPFWSYCLDARDDTEGYGEHSHPWTFDEPWGRVPSVTSVNGVLAKDFLKPWVFNVTCEAAWRMDTESSSATITEPIIAYLREEADELAEKAEKPRTKDENRQKYRGIAVAYRKRADAIERYGWSMPSSWRRFQKDMKATGLDSGSITDDAALRGSEIHLIGERWVTHGEFPKMDTYAESRRGYVRAISRFLAKHGDGLKTAETIVGSAKHGFAGTCDTVFVSEVGDHSERWDYKTSKQCYARTHFRQLGAYELGAVECGEDPTDRQGIVILRPDGEFTIHYADEVEWRDGPAESFLRVLDVWRDEQPLKKHEDATYRERRDREKAAK